MSLWLAHGALDAHMAKQYILGPWSFKAIIDFIDWGYKYRFFSMIFFLYIYNLWYFLSVITRKVIDILTNTISGKWRLKKGAFLALVEKYTWLQLDGTDKSIIDLYIRLSILNDQGLDMINDNQFLIVFIKNMIK